MTFKVNDVCMDILYEFTYVENKVHINCQIMLITIYMNEQ